MCTNRSRAYPKRSIGNLEIDSSVFGFEGTKLQIMARWLSWLERRPVTAEVRGSNPLRVAQQLNIVYMTGVLAQLGEHLPYKQRVTGSSPVGPILQLNTIRV